LAQEPFGDHPNCIPIDIVVAAEMLRCRLFWLFFAASLVRDVTATNTTPAWLMEGQVVYAAKNLFNESDDSQTNVLIPAGAVGRIVQSDPLTINWTQPFELLASVPEDLLVGESCSDQCPGVADYLVAVQEASNLPSLAQTCVSIQANGATTASCFLSAITTIPECAAIQALTTDLNQRCLAINPGYSGDESRGIRIGQPLTPVSYESTDCVLCSYLSGAQATYGANSARLTYDTRAGCEARCNNISYTMCSAFDYDATRSLCRLWQSCPERSWREDTFSCFWTLYHRPCGENCTTAETTTLPTTTAASNATTTTDELFAIQSGTYRLTVATTVAVLLASLGAAKYEQFLV